MLNLKFIGRVVLEIIGLLGRNNQFSENQYNKRVYFKIIKQKSNVKILGFECTCPSNGLNTSILLNHLLKLDYRLVISF